MLSGSQRRLAVAAPSRLSYRRYLDDVGFGGQFGYYTDVETGLNLLTHRYYDPQQGRFVTRDPIGYKGGLNLYSFTLYNPVNEHDPSGLSPGGDEAAGYLANIFDHATVSDWLNALRNNEVVRAVKTLANAASYYPNPENPEFDARVAAETLPLLRGKSVRKIGVMLRRNGFRRTKVSASVARNETWKHADGSQVLIHPYGDVRTGTFRTGNNAHVHKLGPSGVKLNDRGLPDLNPNNTHIGIPNPSDFPSVRGRPHGIGDR